MLASYIDILQKILSPMYTVAFHYNGHVWTPKMILFYKELLFYIRVNGIRNLFLINCIRSLLY